MSFMLSAAPARSPVPRSLESFSLLMHWPGLAFEGMYRGVAASPETDVPVAAMSERSPP